MVGFTIPGVGPDEKTVMKTLTLVGSVLSALAGGTNYAFSGEYILVFGAIIAHLWNVPPQAYAPQLGSRLHIDHTQLNMIALAGNMGVYGSGPPWGAIADSCGPKPLYIIAATLLLTGYTGTKLFYDGVFNLPEGATHDSISFPFFVLILFACLAGAGGSAGLTGSVNAVARSFSDTRRSTVVGFVVSGFGLSAFFFSTLAHAAFSDNTSAFLAVLALGTTLPNVLAYFVVRIVHDDERPEPGEERGYKIIGDEGIDSPVELERRLDEERCNPEPTHISPEATASPPPHSHNHRNAILNKRHSTGARGPSFTERTRSRSPTLSLDLPSEFGNIASPVAEISISHDLEGIPEHPRPCDSCAVDMRARDGSDRRNLLPGNSVGDPDSIPALLRRGDFWLMCGIVSLLSGTGLMWINNVGSITQALVAQGKPDTWDKARAAKVQAAQVSIVSVMNCLGRIIIGVTADHAKHSLGVRRCFWFIPVSLLFVVSQTFARNTTTPDMLWLSSSSLGMAYGAMFSLAPMVIIEWFGLPRFSRNWGTVAFSPVLGGNIFSLAFGMNLDQHASRSITGAVRPRGLPDASDHLCFDGLECYRSSLELTIFACVAATLLSVLAFWRDRRVYAIRDRPIADARASANSDNGDYQAQRAILAEEERLLPSHS